MSKIIEKELQIISNKIVLLKDEIGIGGIVSLIAGIISLFVTFGLVVIIDIWIYWIPSTFIVLFIWSIIGFWNNRKKSFSPKSIDASREEIKKFNEGCIEYVLKILVKNISVFFKALFLVFLLNILVLILHYSDLIILPIHDIIEPLLILLSSIFMLLSPWEIENIPKFLPKIIVNLPYSYNKLERDPKLPEIVRLNLTETIVLIFSLIYLVMLIIVPLWLLIKLLPRLPNFGLLAVVFFLQIISIGIFSSYFSKRNVIRELSEYQYYLSTVKNSKLSEKEILEKKKYTEYKIDNSFKIIDFYWIKPTSEYFKYLLKKEKNDL
jgi:hypothetical protein